MNIRLLELAGSSGDIGRAHGESLRDEVRACVAFYRDLFAMPDDRLRSRALQFKSLIQSYSSDLATEIEGIAAGAAVDEYWIYALNARSELVPFAVPECTAVYCADTAIQGQTWDWARELESLVFLLGIRRDDGHRLLTVTEPGIVAKIGLSSAGVGVCLNFLAAPRCEDGVPVHIVLREVLNASNCVDAAARVRAAGLGKSGNVMIGSTAGQGINFEFAGDSVDERALDEPFVHTNHCLYRDVPAGEGEESSRSRYLRGQDLLRSARVPDLDFVKCLLTDGGSDELSICRPYLPFSGMDIGTVCTVVMDLPRQELHFRLGPNPDAAFEAFSLAALSA